MLTDVAVFRFNVKRRESGGVFYRKSSVRRKLRRAFGFFFFLPLFFKKSRNFFKNLLDGATSLCYNK